MNLTKQIIRRYEKDKTPRQVFYLKIQFDKIRKDMEEISKSVNMKKDDYQVYQEDDGYQD